MKYTELKSVGAFIDQNRIVYPSMIEGDGMVPDLDCGTAFDEISNEWLESLNDDDKRLVDERQTK